MTGHASIATDVLARYAADAAGSVAGVDGLVARPLLRHKGVRVEDGEDGVSVELRLTVAWGASIPHVGAEVERRVGECLVRMADVSAVDIEVVVEEVARP